MKKYIFFIVWLILAVGLAFIAFNSEDSATILAEVEPRSYAVSFEKNVRIKELFVVPGEQVKKGDPLIKVERPDLLIEKENKLNKLALLKANLGKRNLQKENKLYLNDLEFDIKEKQLQNQIQETRTSLDQQKRIQEGFKKLDWQNQIVIDSIRLSKLQLLEGEKELLTREYQLKRKEINSSYALEEANAQAEIELLDKEIQLLEQEEMELTQYARVSGAIGSIQVETDQLVPAYTNLLSVYENNPTVIRAFTNEHNEIELISGTEVMIESTNRQYKIKGTVIEVGSRIIQYPERLRTFDQMPSWGREIFIEIPQESKFLNGEKVFVILQP